MAKIAPNTEYTCPVDSWEWQLPNAVHEEVLRISRGKSLEDRDLDASLTLRDKMTYFAENAVSASPNIQFWALGWVALVLTLVLSALWGEYTTAPYQGDYVEAMWITFQVISSAGFDDTIVEGGERMIYAMMLFCGLVVFAILVGFITEAITTFMSQLSNGSSKIAIEGHTLILGWNESTPRLVCQLAFLRRAHMMQNETWRRRLFPWLRVKASSHAAQAPIVVMCDSKENQPFSKGEMDTLLSAALTERGIDPSRTRIGWDVMCRVGDPTSVHDLVRVGAHKATCIVLMLSDKDAQEGEDSQGKIQNGGTTRGLLALRHVIFAHKPKEELQMVGSEYKLNEELRVVVQLSAPSKYVEAAKWYGPGKLEMVFPLDLSIFLNSLLFTCSVEPGLAQIIMELLDFEGVGIRSRAAEELPGNLVGRTIGESIGVWENAVLMGCVGSHGLEGSTSPGRVEGLAPDSQQIIKAGDILIFLSDSFMPTLAEHNSSDFKAESAALEAQYPIASQPHRHTEPQTILICGWRRKWNKERSYLRDRIDEIVCSLGEGSAIMFMNVVPPEEFNKHMLAPRDEGGLGCMFGTQSLHGVMLHGEEQPRRLEPLCGKTWHPNDGLEHCPKWTYTPDNLPLSEHTPELHAVSIHHYMGDAASYADLAPLIERKAFNACVVLGTAADMKLSPIAQDSRVLSITLLMRHLVLQRRTKGCTLACHIVAENQVDQTALLALTPQESMEMRNEGKYLLPDFINTQAIIARALAQATAFPKIQGALSELFDDEDPKDGSPRLILVNADKCLPLGCGIKFGVVQDRVGKMCGNNVCVGYIDHQKTMVLGPKLSSVHTYKEDARLIFITRNDVASMMTTAMLT